MTAKKRKLTEVEQVIENAWRMPGLYRKREAAFLYTLARRKGNLVELGCWMGRTTSILVQAAKVWGATVTSVDPFVVIPTQALQASAEKWRVNLRKVGLEPPTLLEMTSDEAAELYTDEIALLFIDANHSRAAVARDLDKWTPKVKLGGMVALHDMFYPSVPGVCQAVSFWWAKERDSVREPRWELVGLRDFTIAFRRLR
ncbi:class I SAM-dependent methyltransferase [Patescibacteria group bacterium]|nr:class I SAM-dependent methyltransferase [Patescibacteria group bacterium]